MYWYGSASSRRNELKTSPTGPNIPTDADLAKRVRKGYSMTRRRSGKRFQRGLLIKRGRTKKVWVGRWYEDTFGSDGKPVRSRRSEVLGLVSELSRRDALVALEAKLRRVNDGSQGPIATHTLEEFVKKEWEPAVLPSLTFASRKHYKYVLGT